MSTPSKQRRMRLAIGGVALLAILGVAGCATSNTPTAYNTVTQQNFVELCTNNYYNANGDITDTDPATASNLDPALSATDSTIKADTPAPSEQNCLCMYSVFVNQMPISKAAAADQTEWPNYTGQNFTDLNAKMKTDPEEAWNSLPTSLTDAVKACGSSTPASTSTTTAPAAAETTTTVASSN